MNSVGGERARTFPETPIYEVVRARRSDTDYV